MVLYRRGSGARSHVKHACKHSYTALNTDTHTRTHSALTHLCVLRMNGLDCAAYAAECSRLGGGGGKGKGERTTCDHTLPHRRRAVHQMKPFALSPCVLYRTPNQSTTTPHRTDVPLPDRLRYGVTRARTHASHPLHTIAHMYRAAGAGRCDRDARTVHARRECVLARPAHKTYTHVSRRAHGSHAMVACVCVCDGTIIMPLPHSIPEHRSERAKSRSSRPRTQSPKRVARNRDAQRCGAEKHAHEEKKRLLPECARASAHMWKAYTNRALCIVCCIESYI